MKWIGLLIFFFPSISGMEQELKAAITAGDLEKVTHLICQLQKAPTEDNSLLTKQVDFALLHQFATSLAPEREAQTKTLGHRAVYKRMVIGGGTILVSALTLGNYLYQSISTHQWNFQNLCAATIAGGTAIAHGYKELRLGIQNQDAKNAHAHHVAISHMLLNAQNGNAPYGTL